MTLKLCGIHQRKNYKTKRTGSVWSQCLLQAIHTNKYGPFPALTLSDQQFFIYLIGDVPRYGYIYLI